MPVIETDKVRLFMAINMVIETDKAYFIYGNENGGGGGFARLTLVQSHIAY